MADLETDRVDPGRACAQSDFPRELGRHIGQTPGPLVICVGGMHGNEPAGAFAAQRVVRALESQGPPFRGTLVALAGNRAALARGCRFVAEDFNRMWLPERLAGLSLEAGQSALNVEERECRELLEAIGAALARRRGPIIFLDLHTTSAPGIPFAIIADTLTNRRLARSLPAPVILGLEEQLDGTTLNYMNDRGYAAVGFEGGQNEAPSSIEHNEAALWTILVAAGCLREESIPQAALARTRLAESTVGVPPILEVRYRHAIEADDQFVMEPGYVNFQPVARGQLLARDRRGEIRAGESGRILLPLYQSQGADGFFLVREVSPRWLRVSALARRTRLERLLPVLPGIRRDPQRPDALIVDPRIARWLAVDLLHLLGYRRRRSEGGKIVVTRRPGDIESFSQW
ncbi:MAG TPA: succinylglutamate desuccinylase/aspartoacylase family protein [Candidatus Binataceae bacterium]|nr:succinylglutamate desuccinylase/aspartoacylase family protein [Candidatus Binataceae bacterium]